MFSGTHSDEIAVIREIYDGENAQERFELELERALEAAVPVSLTCFFFQ